MAENTVFNIHGEKCIFCGKIIDGKAVFSGCRSIQNTLPPMTNGTRPHALSARTFKQETEHTTAFEEREAMAEVKQRDPQFELALESLAEECGYSVEVGRTLCSEYEKCSGQYSGVDFAVAVREGTARLKAEKRIAALDAVRKELMEALENAIACTPCSACSEALAHARELDQ